MTTTDIKTKLAQFDEFFSIDYTFNINVNVITQDTPPNFEQFVANMPAPFKIASEVNTLDQNALRPLQAVAGVAGQLMEYLNHQAKKMDLLVGYILSQQDVENNRFQAVKFGGGGIVFNSNSASFDTGNFIEMKLFFSDENTAMYCIGEIVNSEFVTNDHQHTVVFHHIREEDREALVRHSLHQQSKQLQALAQQRNQAKNSE